MQTKPHALENFVEAAKFERERVGIDRHFIAVAAVAPIDEVAQTRTMRFECAKASLALGQHLRGLLAFTAES